MLSFVLLNWNTAGLSQRLIDSLARQTCREFELIVVDNGSKEAFEPATPSWLRTQFLRLDRNWGFAGGMNRGIQMTEGHLICPANSDVVFPPDFVATVLNLRLDTLPHPPGTRIGVLGGLVLIGSCHDTPILPDTFSPSLVDAAGLALSWQGRLVDLPSQWTLTSKPVFAVSGACPIFTRDFCEGISVDGEVYDGRYHSYCEDIDLFMRAKTHGWAVVYAPSVRAYHWGSMSSGGKRRIFEKPPELQRQVFRNMTWNIMKNFTALELVLYLPLHILNVLLVATWAAFPLSNLSLKAALRGYIRDPLRDWPWATARRARLQVRTWYDCRLLREMLDGGWGARQNRKA